jgi:hypothetical protein
VTKARSLCLSTGSFTATTIKSQSSSSLGLHPFHARMRAALANLDEGEFTEGHELDHQVASTEKNDRTPVVAGGSGKIVG